MQIITPRCFSHHVTFYSKHQRGNSNKQTNKQTNEQQKNGLCITDAGNAFKLASESTCKDVVQYHLYAEHKTQTK